jgi:hypothetical protein
MFRWDGVNTWIITLLLIQWWDIPASFVDAQPIEGDD